MNARGQDGFTLPELLVGMTLMLIFGACLAPAVLALRGLPETARSDIVGAAGAPAPLAAASL